MAGDLHRPLRAEVDDHDLLAVGAHPYRLPRKDVRHRVGPALEGDHRGGLPDRAGLAERQRERVGRQRVQPGPLLPQRLNRRAAGHPVGPGVDLLAEPLAGPLQRAETLVGAQQVGFGRHQVRLGDPHRRLRVALGLGVGGHAGGDREAVVAGGGDHVGVAHRDPGRSPGSTSWPATSASSANASACSASLSTSPTAATTASASLISPDTSACLACGSSQAHTGLPGRS